jgi:hypothetical protein
MDEASMPSKEQLYRRGLDCQSGEAHSQDQFASVSTSVKTKIQQRALAGEMYRSPAETLHRLTRGEQSSLLDARIARDLI